MNKWCGPMSYRTKTKKTYHTLYHIEHFQDSYEYHFHGGTIGSNKGHYGDHIFNLKFFYDISDYLEKERITIYYYYNQDHITHPEELECYIHPKTMILNTIDKMPSYGVELWMGREFQHVHYHIIDSYYKVFYKDILEQIKLSHYPIDTGLFQDEPYLEKIYSSLDSSFHNVDVLILNNVPISSKFDYYKWKNQLDETIIQLSKTYKIATLIEINDSIPSTMKNNLRMQDIGAISTHSKIIFGFLSGPMTSCFTKQTKESVKQWIILDPRDGIGFDEVSHIVLKTIDESQISNIIKSII